MFMTSDLNLVLGKILTINSPYYNNEEFIPEARVLRSLTFFNLCEYQHVEVELLQFEKEIGDMQQELKDFTGRYRSSQGKELADQAYEAYFENSPKNTVLPASMFKTFLRNQDLAAFVRHIDVINTEMEIIDIQKALWRDTLGS
jgi:hypothetical protein